jgi:hypothetical protein
MKTTSVPFAQKTSPYEIVKRAIDDAQAHVYAQIRDAPEVMSGSLD